MVVWLAPQLCLQIVAVDPQTSQEDRNLHWDLVQQVFYGAILESGEALIGD